MKVGKSLFILLLLTLPLEAQTLRTFIDSRDGNNYTAVTYKVNLDDTSNSITWMAENLKFKTEDSYCYDDYESNCEIMGRFYSWPAAMNACPINWHLPNNNEWEQLAELFGGKLVAATHLKSTSEYWQAGRSGTNISLFNAMPFGHAMIGSGYYGFQSNATFWSSTEIDEDHATDWVLSDIDRLISYKGQKSIAGNSVRCVKD